MSTDLNLPETDHWNPEIPFQDSANVLGKKKALSKFIDSSFMYWSGRVANWSFVVGTLAVGCWQVTAENWLQAPAYFVGGFIGWSFSEYVFHRWLYHRNESMFAVGHLMHHDEPQALIGMPWPVYIPVLVGIWYLTTLLTGRLGASFAFSGWWLGYIGYVMVHHAIHHSEYNAGWFKKLKAHHKIHHKLPDKNLGVTTILWDRLFGSRV